ncbi:MAG: hypothetical protein ACRD4C_08420 [Candidatus Acidiferrales bacterium]
MDQKIEVSSVVGSPSGSQTDPTLGEVIVVDSAPGGVPDVFLGTIAENNEVIVSGGGSL